MCGRMTPKRIYSPTTLLGLLRPSLLDDNWPSGIVEAAILVILIEDVFVASIVEDGSSAASRPKMACLRDKDSDTA
jgi:hypothetical protein